MSKGDDMQKLKPETPGEAGLAERLPGPLQVEGAELLANEARDRLRAARFTDEEIDSWAMAYIAMEHSGDVASFLDWIEREEMNGETH
jgi:hypothetical protein